MTIQDKQVETQEEKKHKKYRKYRSLSSDSSESWECKQKKHKHHGSKHHKKQKHHRNSNPFRIDNKERHSDRNFEDRYYRDRIAYHWERNKFDDGYHYRDQGSYDRSPKADSHNRYYRDNHAIDRHYDRDRGRDRYYERDNQDRGRHFPDHFYKETIGYHSEHKINLKYKREIRHILTEQHFQPEHFINHLGYPTHHTNYQYTEPILSVPSQYLDLIKACW